MDRTIAELKAQMAAAATEEWLREREAGLPGGSNSRADQLQMQILQLMVETVASHLQEHKFHQDVIDLILRTPEEMMAARNRQP